TLVTMEAGGHEGCNRPLLAAESAGRGSGAGGAVPPAPRRRPVHALLRARTCQPGAPCATRPSLVSQSVAALLPGAVAADADGPRALRSARLRPGDQPRVGTCEGRIGAVGRASCLLLPHPDAVSLGPLSSLHAGVDSGVETPAYGAPGELPALV